MKELTLLNCNFVCNNFQTANLFYWTKFPTVPRSLSEDTEVILPSVFKQMSENVHAYL